MKQLWFPESELVRPVALKGLPALASNNVYVLGRGPVTLIDAGIKSPEALEQIRASLAGDGLSFRDVERVILTHGHIDHYGLAAEIERQAGRPVEVWVHPADAGRVRAAWSDAKWRALAQELALMGVPDEDLNRMQSRFAMINLLADPVAEPRLLVDGQVFAGDGWRLEVIHTPGHSSGSVCLFERDAGLLFCGDLILKGIFPSPFVELDQPGASGYGPYLASLERLEGLPVTAILPGHGAACVDLIEIVTRYRRHQQQELARVRTLLGSQPRPLYELALAGYPQSVRRDVFLSLMKTAVYLEAMAPELFVDGYRYALKPDNG